MINILLAEGFSCQRDLIKNIKASDYMSRLKVFACHSQNRLDVFKYADGVKIIDRKSALNDEHFIQQYLDYCTQEHIHVVITGQHTKLFEAHRSKFEEKEIVFYNGAKGVQNHIDMDDKLAFTARCLANDLPVVPAYKFTSRAEFEALHAEKTQQYGVMAVKPAKGVYASGFFQLNPEVPLFEALSEKYIATPEMFAQAYGALDKKPVYMLMPYFSGLECTVDVACMDGLIVSAVVRTKYKDGTQMLELEHPCIELAKKFVAHFACSGIVGIQFIQDQQGEWLALEINARASGGIGYTMATGVNIAAVLIDETLRKQKHKIFIQGRKWTESKVLIRSVSTAITLS